MRFNADNYSSLFVSGPECERARPRSLRRKKDGNARLRIRQTEAVPEIIKTLLLLRLKRLRNVSRSLVCKSLVLRPNVLQIRCFDSIQSFRVADGRVANANRLTLSGSDRLRRLRELLHSFRTVFRFRESSVDGGPSAAQPTAKFRVELAGDSHRFL